MKITKHGDIVAEKELGKESFTCANCGCEFTADYDEYYIEKGTCITTSSSLSYTYSTNVTDKYICSCPECHKIVTKSKSRIAESPVITLTSNSTGSNVPDVCKNCSNHPNNGGSGNCNCALPSLGQITCEGEK